MRRLVEQQLVTVNIDGEAAGIDCRVGSVLGPVAMLTPAAELAQHLRERLAPGTLGFLVFDHQDTPTALRGVARLTEGPQLEFVVIDGVQIAQRRAATRVALITPVRATLVDSDGIAKAAVETVTANLSQSGALLTRRPGLGEGPRWHIELLLPGDPTPIRCGAVLARQTPTHVGVAFANMQQLDQIRLARTLAGLSK